MSPRTALVLLTLLACNRPREVERPRFVLPNHGMTAGRTARGLRVENTGRATWVRPTIEVDFRYKAFVREDVPPGSFVDVVPQSFIAKDGSIAPADLRPEFVVVRAGDLTFSEAVSGPDGLPLLSR